MTKVISISSMPVSTLSLSLSLSPRFLNTAHHMVHAIHFLAPRHFPVHPSVCTHYFGLAKLGHSAHSWVLHPPIRLFGWLRACSSHTYVWGTVTRVSSCSQNPYYNCVCLSVCVCITVCVCVCPT